MKFKIFLISSLISLPFWWAMNVFADNLLEDFLFEQEMLTAELNQKIFEKLKLEREKRERLRSLEIEAKAAVSVQVNNKGNEKILFEKNSQQPLPIASLTKLMTALIVFDFDETYKRSQSIENLLYIMLIESNNDAAVDLTEPVGEKAFVELMNLYAKQIGLEDTYFVNPTGLEPDDPQDKMNISTARDLVKLSRYILESYPEIFEITTYTPSQNTNELLGEIPGIIGGKTGWGPEAGGCLLLVLDDPKGSYFINIVLGATNRFQEMRKIIDAIQN